MERRKMKNEPIPASPEFVKFFERLLLLKKKIWFYKESGDSVMDEIYNELDSIIKEAQ